MRRFLPRGPNLPCDVSNATSVGVAGFAANMTELILGSQLLMKQVPEAFNDLLYKGSV